MKKFVVSVLLHAVAFLGIQVQKLFVKQGLVMGANTLTDLIPTLYEAMDVVSRELVGFIPAVSRDSSPERAALNQTINIPIVPATTAYDITPGTTAPDNGDQTIGNTTMTISKARMAPVRWTGEEQRAVGHSGLAGNVVRDQFAQAMRVLVNEVEADLAALYKFASRAYGTAGTAPFGTAGDLSDFAQIRKILEDNGAPTGDLQIVCNTSATANLRGKQSVLFKVNEAGSAELLRAGTLGVVEGLAIHSSGQAKSHTKGTGASYLVNDATNLAIGDTAIVVDTGSGTVLAGDVVTLAGDTNKYIVGTALAANTFSLNAPGLLVAHADNDAVTVGNSYSANVAFSRSAMHLVTRAPAMPEGGDMADDIIEITDPITGLSFQVAVYRQYRRVKYEVGLAWGVKASKPEHIALLLG